MTLGTAAEVKARLASSSVRSSNVQTPKTTQLPQSPAKKGVKKIAKDAVEEEGMMSEHHDMKAAVATCVVLMLILMSVGFETVREALEKATSKNIKPVLLALFGELMLLGFVGLFLFCLGKIGILKEVSKMIFGDSTEEERNMLNEICEMVHMILFLVMIFFLFKTVVSIFMANSIERTWKKWQQELLDTGTLAELPSVEEFAHPEKPVDPWDPYSPAELFFLTRLSFIHSKQVVRGTHNKAELPLDFDMAEYLSIHCGNMLAELVEIPIVMWAYMALVTALLYILYLVSSFEVQVVILLIGSWSLPLLLYFATRHLRHLRMELLRPSFTTAQLVSIQAAAFRWQDQASAGACCSDEASVCSPNQPPPRLNSQVLKRMQAGTHHPHETPLTLEAEELMGRQADAGRSLPVDSSTGAALAGPSTDPLLAGPSLEDWNIYCETMAVDGGREVLKHLFEVPDHRPKFWCSGTSGSSCPWFCSGKRKVGSKKHVADFLMSVISGTKLMQSLVVSIILVVYLVPLIQRGFMGYSAEESCHLPHEVAVLFCFALVPPSLIQLLMMPQVLDDLTVVTSVNTMVKAGIIDKVVRWQTASRSIRALRMVAQMRLSARQAMVRNSKVTSPRSREDSAYKASQGGFFNVGMGNIVQLIQAEMEESGKHQWEVEDFEQYLIVHDLCDEAHAAKEAAYLIRRGDLDGDGKLDLHEISALVHCIETADTGMSTSQIAKHVFGQAGKKPTETLSRSELREMLEALAGEPVQYEDVDVLMAEADINEDEVLDIAEFTHLLEVLTSPPAKSQASTRGCLPGQGSRPSISSQRAHNIVRKSADAVKTMEKSLAMVRVLDHIVAVCQPGEDEARKGMGDHEREMLASVFHRFDKDGGGQLDHLEMQKFLQAVGAADKDKPEQAAQIVYLLDADQSGTVSFTEFMRYADEQKKVMGEVTDEQLAKELFDMIDHDRSGEVSVGEIQEVLSAIGATLSVEDVVALIKEVDDDDNVTLNFDEFKLLLHKLGLHKH